MTYLQIAHQWKSPSFLIGWDFDQWRSIYSYDCLLKRFTASLLLLILSAKPCSFVRSFYHRKYMLISQSFVILLSSIDKSAIYLSKITFAYKISLFLLFQSLASTMPPFKQFPSIEFNSTRTNSSILVVEYSSRTSSDPPISFLHLSRYLRTWTICHIRTKLVISWSKGSIENCWRLSHRSFSFRTLHNQSQCFINITCTLQCLLPSWNVLIKGWSRTSSREWNHLSIPWLDVWFRWTFEKSITIEKYWGIQSIESSFKIHRCSNYWTMGFSKFRFIEQWSFTYRTYSSQIFSTE